MIISTTGDPLSAIMRDFKKHTSKEVIETLGTVNESRKEWLLEAFAGAGRDLKRISSYKVWQDGNHPVLLDSNSLIEQKLNYIHDNPIEDETVDEPQHYLYSSARDYAGDKGLLEVVFLD